MQSPGDETAGATRPPTSPAHVSSRAIAVAAIVLAGLWAFDAFVLRTDLLASIGTRPATSPYYAVLGPLASSGALVFVLAAAGFALVAPRLCDPSRTSGRAFAPVLFACAAAIPFALFLVRASAAGLGTQFLMYPQDEFLHDARQIHDYATFLGQYVEHMPSLSLHGKHFPPGHASLLYFVEQAFGGSELAVGIVVLAIAAAGVVCAWRGLRELAGEAESRQAACLLLAAPALLDNFCTSMDAVFFAAAALAWWLSLRAARKGHAIDAVLAGAALFAATWFSFSALPLGLVIAVHAVVAGRRRPLGAARRLAILGASYTACAAALYFASGFPIWSCFLRARALGFEFMERIMLTREHAGWLNITYGNAAAFLIGAGAAFVAAVAVALRAREVRPSPWTIAALITLAVMAAGRIHWMETERIWMYVLPWLAAIAVARGPLDASSLRRVLAWGCAQALVMEIVLFTLW